VAGTAKYGPFAVPDAPEPQVVVEIPRPHLDLAVKLIVAGGSLKDLELQPTDAFYARPLKGQAPRLMLVNDELRAHDVEPGEYAILVPERLHKKYHVPKEKYIKVTPGETARADFVLRLKEYSSLSLRITVGKNGLPLARATVNISDSGGGKFAAKVTDSEGRCTFDNVTLGDCSADISAQDSLSERRRFAHTGKEEVNISLGWKVFSGTVEAAGGEATTGNMILIEAGTRKRYYCSFFDKDGRFAVLHQLNGPAALLIQTPEHGADWMMVDCSQADQHRNVKLGEPLPIKFTVTSEDDLGKELKDYFVAFAKKASFVAPLGPPVEIEPGAERTAKLIRGLYTVYVVGKPGPHGVKQQGVLMYPIGEIEAPQKAPARFRIEKATFEAEPVTPYSGDFSSLDGEGANGKDKP